MKIEKNIPAPAVRKRRPFPFEQMEVGDSFAVQDDTVSAAKMSASRMNKNGSGKQFTIQKTESGYRCWRVA